MFKGQTVSVILLAAGASARMGENKILFRFCGKTPIELCIDAFSEFADEIIIACSESTKFAAEQAARCIDVPSYVTAGGATRQLSVANALSYAHMDIVSIHDCARCLVTPDVIRRSLDAAVEHGCGITSIPVSDTIRYKRSGETVDRAALIAAQTPQSFNREMFLDAHRNASKDYTDDAALFLDAGYTLHYSLGDKSNIKLTTPDDIAVFDAILSVRRGVNA